MEDAQMAIWRGEDGAKLARQELALEASMQNLALGGVPGTNGGTQRFD